MQNEYEKTFKGNIIRNKFVYKGEIMSTKDVMKEILKEYKKFIKAGKDKKKFINYVNDLLEKNGINNDDMLEIIKLEHKQYEMANMPTLTFAMTLAAPIFTSGIAAVLGVWSVISNTINLTVKTIGENSPAYVDAMTELLEMTADSMLKSIVYVVIGFILFILFAIIVAGLGDRNRKIKRRCYELTVDILNQRRDREKK